MALAGTAVSHGDGCFLDEKTQENMTGSQAEQGERRIHDAVRQHNNREELMAVKEEHKRL